MFRFLLFFRPFVLFLLFFPTVCWVQDLCGCVLSLCVMPGVSFCCSSMYGRMVVKGMFRIFPSGRMDGKVVMVCQDTPPQFLLDERGPRRHKLR